MAISHALNTFPSNPGFARFCSLIGSKEDPFEAFKALYATIDEILPALVRGVRYSCEALCGPILWNRYASKGQHRALGIALKHLVDDNALPLECVTPYQNNKYYTPNEGGPSCSANALTVVQQPSLSYQPECAILQEV